MDTGKDTHKAFKWPDLCKRTSVNSLPLIQYHLTNHFLFQVMNRFLDLGLLSLDIPDVDSTRRFDAEGNLLCHYDTDGTFIPDDPSTGFTGCHGEKVDGSASPYGGLVITVDDTGAVIDLLWHFDDYLETTGRGKCGKPMVSVMELAATEMAASAIEGPPTT